MVAKPTWRRWPRPDELRAMLDYNPDTGVLTWKPLEGEECLNEEPFDYTAGHLKSSGCIAVIIDGRWFYAHRLIWAMVHNTWPECVTHKNGNRADNRLENLSADSRLTCQRRQRMHRTNTSGRTGVYWIKAGKCWVAQIQMFGVTHYLGRFARFEDAVAAREQAERENGFEFRV